MRKIIYTAAGIPAVYLFFLAGMNFWEGLFDNVNIKLIRNLLAFQLPDISHILMTIIVPNRLPAEKAGLLSKKEDLIKNIADAYKISVEFCHIRGRTISGLKAARKEICRKTILFEKRFIWGSNYFNCFLGVLIKRQIPNTLLHFEMMGLAPEEELLYSESRTAYKIFKFLTLRCLCRINLKYADSISVVSKQFKHYMIARYGVSASLIDVIPCFYDDKVFYVDRKLRNRFRIKYHIADNQETDFIQRDASILADAGGAVCIFPKNTASGYPT